MNEIGKGRKLSEKGRQEKKKKRISIKMNVGGIFGCLEKREMKGEKKCSDCYGGSV